MSTNVIKRTPAAGGPSYNPGDPFHVPDQGQYGPRPRDFHVGIDYAAPAGTPIPAASSGEVVYSGPSGGFHYAVMVKSTGPNGVYYSVYGHVDPEGALPVGTRVAIGQPIAAVGMPHPEEGELSSGPHFHFQIATEEKVSGAKKKAAPPGGRLGFTTKDHVFENPDEFKGWATEDKAPYNALTYVPMRDGATFQPVPNLAEASQANQLFSRTNSFNPPGLSPAEINRFYSKTGRPSADPSGYPEDGASRGAAGPNTATGISQAGIDRLYNFTQLGRSTTAPSATDGLNAPNRTASAPWYSSPAVTGNYTPTENFNWNNVPTGSPGDRGPLPPNGSGNAPAPALRVAQQDRRSAAPDDPVWVSAQGAMPAVPTSPQNAAYSPASNVAGNFIRTPVVAAPPPSAPSGVLGLNPALWTASDPAAVAQEMRNLAGGAGRFIRSGLLSSAEPASPSNSLWPSTTTALDRSGNPGFSGGLLGRLAAVLAGVDPTIQPQPAASQSDGGTQGSDETPVRRLSRSNNNSPDLVADASAPAPRFVLPGDLTLNGDLADWLANLANFSLQNRA